MASLLLPLLYLAHGCLRVVVVYEIIYRHRYDVAQRKWKKYNRDEILKFRLIYSRYGSYIFPYA